MDCFTINPFIPQIRCTGTQPVPTEQPEKTSEETPDAQDKQPIEAVIKQPPPASVLPCTTTTANSLKTKLVINTRGIW